MTLFDLVIRSMRKNIKHYYLYFFALIFSVVLYFVFATLQYDAAIVNKAGESASFSSAFKVASILLIIIAGVFIVYANTIFLKRRSREIGLYQLIGLNKSAVSRLLIIENIVLGVGALILGILIGLLVSRVFLLLLMKLIGHEGFIALSFSMSAVLQTLLVFTGIILLTTIQMVYMVYQNSLLNLFNANKQGEHPKKPKAVTSAFLAIVGIGLIGFGYWLSGNMINELLLFNMVAVLASTILGTYLVFRVTIGWLLYQIRKKKQGHLGLKNSLSIASLMHRMKGNANSLTIITVLSAMTLAMVAGAYSLFYATEKETRYMMPFDHMFNDDYHSVNEFTLAEFEDKLREKNIGYQVESIELLNVEGSYEKGIFPAWIGEQEGDFTFTVVSAKQLQKAGLDVIEPSDGEAILHDLSLDIMAKEIKVPFTIRLPYQEQDRLTVLKLGEGNILNSNWGKQLVVSDAYFEQLKNIKSVASSLKPVSAVTISNPQQLAEASSIRYAHIEDRNTIYHLDFYTPYQSAMQTNGLLIFITGFLGLVFLISTGSILYFKQMTEAEQEKGSYATLRQLGFTKKEMMQGIIRKQIFVFGLPLVIGLLHSIFAIKSASFLFMSDITVPTTIAMSVYGLIYLVFAFLSVGYYKKVVTEAF